MLTYDEIKTWYRQKENKDKVVLGVSFVLVFLVGFGTGSYVKQTRTVGAKSQSNYTTSPAKTPTTKPAVVTAPAVAGASTTPASNCLIKGNISTSGRKIYHVPTGALYKVVKPEQCFNTEDEALAAGFVKSGR